MACPVRTYPLRKPLNHRLLIPRWQLSLPEGAKAVHTAYVGIQQHSSDNTIDVQRAWTEAAEKIQSWLTSGTGPSAIESCRVIDGNDVQDAVIWICYWSNTELFHKALEGLSLAALHMTFTTTSQRLETNYSGLDYLPGLAKLPRTSTSEHTLSAYWGATRDRVPDSAHDLFEPDSTSLPPEATPTGLGQRLSGSNLRNIVHIRSGQLWEHCDVQESGSYEQKLEPTLRAGLKYLWTNPGCTGALGLRYLRNDEPTYRPVLPHRKESCGAGFFTSLEHLKTGAMSYFKTFRDTRKLRTWHEVSVLREGDARFEYLNCTLQTGVAANLRLTVEDLNVESMSTN
ncbi:heme-containing dehydratase protein [Fusarium oxysporum]|nr:heme-containing dehydratase protein [Fusarium oxysporum]